MLRVYTLVESLPSPIVEQSVCILTTIVFFLIVVEVKVVCHDSLMEKKDTS